MRDLTSVRLIHLKAALFCVLGVLASSGILLACPSVEVALLLVVAIWAFARLYFYAFFVIGHYVDPAFRYRGLLSVALYFARGRSVASKTVAKR